MIIEKKYYIGIDPGNNGGIVVIDENSEVINWYKMPINSKKVYRQRIKNEIKKSCRTVDITIDFKKVIELISIAGIQKISIETQQAHPDQGRSSIGKTMYQFGALVGICEGLGIEYDVIRPQDWKKYFNLSADKNRSIDLAIKMSGCKFIPLACRVPHDGICEAYLIAEYGRRRITK